MKESYFGGIKPVAYEGRDSENPLCYRYYNKDQVVLGKTMQEHLRPAVCYWHTFAWPGSDVFGNGTFDRPWHRAGDPMQLAQTKLHSAFELFEKLGLPFFTFHDADVAPEGSSLRESHANLDRIVESMQAEMSRTKVGLLWGTANLFSHPRYLAGAATNPDPEVFAYAAAQVKKMLEVTHRLGGSNYVLWGGREGYETLLNTDMKRELDQLGCFMSLVAEHKAKIGFKGTLLIEPKPKEPTKHQYDFDTAAVYAFLQKYKLEKEFKVNIEANHAILAGHSFEHEIAYAINNDIFGSVDINRGDYLLGWDTDQFPNDVVEIALVLLRIVRAGGFKTGGLNFDAKLRRPSIDPEDLFYAHIGAMDALAKGLLVAERMHQDRKLETVVQKRYARWDQELGQQITQRKLSLADLSDLALEKGINPVPRSGRQELLENMINYYL